MNRVYATVQINTMNGTFKIYVFSNKTIAEEFISTSDDPREFSDIEETDIDADFKDRK